MKDTLMLIIKGFIMGVANIIPGVSGGTLALTLGIYERFISSISHFFSKIKENLKFLIPIFIGMVLSIASMSSVIDTSFKKFPIPTTLFFVGLVIGGIPLIIKKIKGTKDIKKPVNYVIALVTFLMVVLLAFSKEIFGGGLAEANLNDVGFSGYVVLFLVGMIAAATMVIPGVSGSLVLMLLGYYFPIVRTIKHLTRFQNIGTNIIILGFFGIGVLVGIVLVAKLIEYLLNKFANKTYFGVLGFIFASVIAIFVSVYHEVGPITFSFPQIIIGLIFLLLGLGIGYKLGDE